MSEFENLVETVGRYSRSAVLQDEGFKVVVSERGARILGIFLDSSPNLLWVNPKIEEVFSTNGWNVGGLRLWISPERNFFYRNPESFEDWFCPEGIDPGDYRIAEANSRKVLLEGAISAYDHLQGAELKARVRREIRVWEYGRGYLRLKIREALLGEYSGRVNPWILAQVPPGYTGFGTVLVPVRRRAEPIHYFVEIPRDRLKVLANHVSFKIDGGYVSKLGIKPEDLRDPDLGGIAYVARIGKRNWSALILRTHDHPRSQEDCLDVPKRDPSLPRAAVQSYNSGPEAFPDIRFGEIELQLTPTINLDGRIFVTVEYDVMAFIGAKSRILTALRRALKITKPKLY